ncbi:hypothetical protein [Collinsella tanakaei]|uniref:hypothetical protein n=1 Tax=Collinsella tanakaei TaxID=626935 RepID=UPI00248D5DD6|nr:hypothetical protein [Collinsella tanakaei]
MKLTKMLVDMEYEANLIREYAFENGCMPSDYKTRLQRIRRLCNKILVGEFELDEEAADGGPR